MKKLFFIYSFTLFIISCNKDEVKNDEISGLFINEFLASNDACCADEKGEYDDWVELYNGNSFDLNLNGYYLSDNENDLTKWSFPNVIIPANDYLIIWCDTAGSTQTGLHTIYRLSADQEEVYLTSPTGVVVDAVHYVCLLYTSPSPRDS